MKNWTKILLAFLLIAVFAIAYFYLGKITIGRILGGGPEQPIFFSHKIHAGDNQIPCQYCHLYVTKSTTAGIPSLQRCMSCHNQVAGRDVQYKAINIQKEIQKLKAYWEKSQAEGVSQIQWIRVHNLPEYVHFTHKRHILRGFDCSVCHGDVKNMDVVHRVGKLNMGWCINCHMANAKDQEQLTLLKDCATCHY
ncbi:MAG: cytochrome c3 family protein [Ignavibacteriales bacterium]